MDAVVNLLAARPGQRTLLLVSSGFLTATREKSIDALIDRRAAPERSGERD